MGKKIKQKLCVTTPLCVSQQSNAEKLICKQNWPFLCYLTTAALKNSRNVESKGRTREISNSVWVT